MIEFDTQTLFTVINNRGEEDEQCTNDMTAFIQTKQLQSKKRKETKQKENPLKTLLRTMLTLQQLPILIQEVKVIYQA